MTASNHELAFNGGLLKRGFWLYIWEITQPDGAKIYYVGRTGDSSSSHAQSPFNRMSHHLGGNSRSNVLRRRLTGISIEPELCSFRMVAHGPISEEAGSSDAHCVHRDEIAALEKALAEAMNDCGYPVMNRVHCLKPLDNELFEGVRRAFGASFPALLSRPFELNDTP